MEASEAHLKVKSDILTNKYGQCAYGRTGGTQKSNLWCLSALFLTYGQTDVR